jgi:hypothetical protein
MGDYPPKLIGVTQTSSGAILALSDGRAIPTDIGPDRLNQALEACGRPPLDELLAASSLAVFADRWDTMDSDWDRICAAIVASPVANAAFNQIPSVWAAFHQPATLVGMLPQRVYGGLDQALYTSHRFHFRTDPNRPFLWRRSLLSAPGGRIFNTWVHMDHGQVEVEAAVLPGHFVE